MASLVKQLSKRLSTIKGLARGIGRQRRASNALSNTQQALRDFSEAVGAVSFDVDVVKWTPVSLARVLKATDPVIILSALEISDRDDDLQALLVPPEVNRAILITGTMVAVEGLALILLENIEQFGAIADEVLEGAGDLLSFKFSAIGRIRESLARLPDAIYQVEQAATNLITSISETAEQLDTLAVPIRQEIERVAERVKKIVAEAPEAVQAIADDVLEQTRDAERATRAAALDAVKQLKQAKENVIRKTINELEDI